MEDGASAGQHPKETGDGTLITSATEGSAHGE